MNSLLALLLETGMLQFGRFVDADGSRPYRLHLDLLPSYPDVLAHITELALPLMSQVDHLLSPADALPFGLSVSLRTQIPLVYARGTSDAAALDLAGAYDIGHPALLVANALAPPLEELADQAKIVGLETQAIVVIVDEGLYATSNIRVHSLLDFRRVIPQLRESGRLPVGHANTVQSWIEANRHPDSTTP